MPTHPARLFPVLVIGIFAIVAFSAQGFCAWSDKNRELTIYQQQARTYREQGIALQKDGDIQAALSYYQKAIALDATYVVAFNDVGIIYEGMGYLDRAREMYVKAIEIDPTYPDSYSNLALLYESQKDYASAVWCWVKRATLGGAEDEWAQAARRRLEDIARSYPEAYRMVGEGTSKPTLFEDEGVVTGHEVVDNVTRARNYLARAKRSFAQGDMVAALKEATMAEYFDSSSEEVSSFVEKVRKALVR